VTRIPLLLLALIGGAPAHAAPQGDCADVSACRGAALEAAARGDYETFHDLAWRTVQKGRSNDPELMLLLARAQSLSGRPGDALVMLRRLAERGARPDVRTDDDFRRVRTLQGWAEVEALLTAGATEPPSTRETPTTPATAPTPDSTVEPKSAAEKSEARTTPSPLANAATRVNVRPRTPTKTSRTDAAWADNELRVSGASLATMGLAHDSVSRRFIVGDPSVNKLVVVDEVFNRVNDLVGAASGGFFGLRALEIDGRRGDLWVANSGAERRPAVHKLQLVSGRVLFELPLPADFGDAFFEDLAVASSGAVLIVDSRGRRLLRVPPGGRVFEGALEDASLAGARSVAPVNDRIAYVANGGGLIRADLQDGTATAVQIARGARLDGAVLEGLKRIRWHGGALVAVRADADGTCRILRIALNKAGTRVTSVEVLDADAAMPDPTAAAVDKGVLFYLTQENGASIVRRLALERGR
jgi:hypothetical protein